MKQNSPVLSLSSSPAREPAATPIPPALSSGNAIRPARPGSRSTGAASAMAIRAAETKFSANSVPMVGIAE
jgi:hypothetical protein